MYKFSAAYTKVPVCLYNNYFSDINWQKMLSTFFYFVSANKSSNIYNKLLSSVASFACIKWDVYKRKISTLQSTQKEWNIPN